MNVYEAIMKAADWIELQPDQFRFMASRVPDCGSPGCALGWIGYFAGCKRGENVLDVAKSILGCPLRHRKNAPVGSPELSFYDRVNDLFGGGHWINSPKNCARALRLYAEKYHAPSKPVRNFAREMYEKVSVAPRIPENA